MEKHGGLARHCEGVGLTILLALRVRGKIDWHSSFPMASSSSSSASSSSASSSHSPSPEPVSKKRRSSAISDSDSSNDSDSSDSELEQSNEPVLSHAAKRKEKRKLKTKDTEAPEGDKKKSTKAASATQPKRQNSVWVGNLSFKTTAEALRRFFGDAEITRVHMPTKAGDKNPNGPDRKENRGFVHPPRLVNLRWKIL